MKTLFSRLAKDEAIGRMEGRNLAKRSDWLEHGAVPKAERKPEEIAAKLRQVDVLLSQGRRVTEAIDQAGLSPFAYYRWRKEVEGPRNNQVKRLQHLEQENDRLRKAVSDLIVEKLILKEVAA